MRNLTKTCEQRQPLRNPFFQKARGGFNKCQYTWCIQFQVLSLATYCISTYGSRPKTHARLLVSEWHLQIWMCMFCCSGERPRKGGVRFAKGLNTIIYKPISKRKPDHNLMSRFCWGAKGRERFAKARRKGVFGYHNFGQPPCTVFCSCFLMFIQVPGGEMATSMMILMRVSGM